MIHPQAKIGENTKFWYDNFSNIGNCTIGKNSTIHSHVWIGDGVRIGDNAKIQAFVFIPTGVTIGKNVFVGPGVMFTNDKHPPSGGLRWSETTVEDGVIIGAGAIILPGITLGKRSVIGAGSVVTKSVPPNAVVVGNPAVIHKRG